MRSLVVVGAQWGDEGKGKIVDLLADRADYVMRYQGGSNAGHTLIVEGKKLVLHIIPSGVLRRQTVMGIGNGTVIDPIAFAEELRMLQTAGIELTPERLVIAHEAHLVMPYHRVLDRLSEATRGEKKIGTTGRGIGPAYVDKVGRRGIRAGDLRNPELFKEKLKANLGEKNAAWVTIDDDHRFDLQQTYEQIMAVADQLVQFLGDPSRLCHRALEAGKAVLFEGAQGTCLDVDHGTYPFVTSSSAIAGGVCTGLGIGPTRIGGVLGVVKAYATRVGEGPMPTELSNGLGAQIRQVGGEFGSTTGRARRCGWLDLPALRKSVRVNGMTALAITKLDVLSSIGPLKICTHYRLDGQLLDEPPSCSDQLARAEPIYATFGRWEENIRSVRQFDQLPSAAILYLRYVEEQLGVPLALISVGEDRDATIFLKDPWG